MKRAAVYIRVSTHLQDNSVETQQARVQDYIAWQKDIEICHIVKGEDVSGGKPLYDREGGAQLKKLIENKEIDCIIATKADRVFRNTVDALTTVASWNDKNISLHLLDIGGLAIDTKSAAGKMVFSVLITFSEFERNRGGERTKEVLGHKKKNLKPYSACPYGYRVEGRITNNEGKVIDPGRLVEDPEQQKAICLMKEWKAKGQSAQHIATTLNKLNVKPSKGDQWARSSIRQILDNELHA